MSEATKNSKIKTEIKKLQIKVKDAKDAVKNAKDEVKSAEKEVKQSEEILAINSADLRAVERAKLDGVKTINSLGRQLSTEERVIALRNDCEEGPLILLDADNGIELLERQLSAEGKMQGSRKERQGELQIQVDKGREYVAADKQKVAVAQEKLDEETGYLISYKKKIRKLRTIMVTNAAGPICSVIIFLVIFLSVPIASIVMGVKYSDPELIIPKMLIIHGALLTGSIVLPLFGVLISPIDATSRVGCLAFVLPGIILLMFRPIFEVTIFTVAVTSFTEEFYQFGSDPEMIQLYIFCNAWFYINAIKMLVYTPMMLCGGRRNE